MRPRSAFPVLVVSALAPAVWASSAGATGGPVPTPAPAPTTTVTATATDPTGDGSTTPGLAPQARPARDITGTRASYAPDGTLTLAVTFAEAPTAADSTHVEATFYSRAEGSLCTGDLETLAGDSTSTSATVTATGVPATTGTTAVSGTTMTLTAPPVLGPHAWACAMVDSRSVSATPSDGDDVSVLFPAPATTTPAPTPARRLGVTADRLPTVRRGTRARLRLHVANPTTADVHGGRIRLTLPSGVRAKVHGRIRSGTATVTVPTVRAAHGRTLAVTLITSRSARKRSTVTARTTAGAARVTTRIPLRLR